MMDANDDWAGRGGDAFRNFLEEVGLEDPLHQKFHYDSLTHTTYAQGSRRINYIFVDSTILPSIRRNGTLGLHEEIISDHVMLYMDCGTRKSFSGEL